MAKNTTVWIVIAAIIIVLILGYVWYSQTQSSKPINNITQDNTPSSGKTHNIEISNLAFSAPSLIIKQGDTVVWTNKDSVTHTVTSDRQDEMSSKLLKTNEVYSHTFNTMGTFDYHCEVHPMMKASITVQ